VDGEIIEHDHIAGAERRHEDLLDVGEKRRIVDRAVEDGRGGEALKAQSRRPQDDGAVFNVTDEELRKTMQQKLWSRKS
jgi:hypothetical protein